VSAVTKAVVFWLLIGSSAIALWYTFSRGDRFSWSDVLVPVVTVVLFFWIESRFQPLRRRPLSIMLTSGLMAVASAMWAVFKFQLLRYGFGGRSGLAEGVVAVALFGVCVSVSIWQFLRFRSTAGQSQPDVGRQTQQPWICSRFTESRLASNIGLEELQNRAWSEVSKTHNLQKRVQPAQAGEDDIWQLNRLGKIQGVVNFYECLREAAGVRKQVSKWKGFKVSRFSTLKTRNLENIETWFVRWAAIKAHRV
jgi:hypothetical protein